MVESQEQLNVLRLAWCFHAWHRCVVSITDQHVNVANVVLPNVLIIDMQKMKFQESAASQAGMHRQAVLGRFPLHGCRASCNNLTSSADHENPNWLLWPGNRCCGIRTCKQGKVEIYMQENLKCGTSYRSVEPGRSFRAFCWSNGCFNVQHWQTGSVSFRICRVCQDCRPWQEMSWRMVQKHMLLFQEYCAHIKHIITFWKPHICKAHASTQQRLSRWFPTWRLTT